MLAPKISHGTLDTRALFSAPQLLFFYEEVSLQTVTKRLKKSSLSFARSYNLIFLYFKVKRKVATLFLPGTPVFQLLAIFFHTTQEKLRLQKQMTLWL